MVNVHKDAIMAKVKITQKKSKIDQTKRQKETLRAVGLRKINQSVEKEMNPQIRGMIDKVSHLVEVEEI
jgi:large subunit ribosomal protein L30